MKYKQLIHFLMEWAVGPVSFCFHKVWTSWLEDEAWPIAQIRASGGSPLLGSMKSSFKINFHHHLTSMLPFSAASWASLFLHHTCFCYMLSVFLQVNRSLSVLSMSFIPSRCHMIFVNLAGDWEKSIFICGVKNPAYDRRLNLRKRKGCQSPVGWPPPSLYYSCCCISIIRFYKKKFAVSSYYVVWIDTW